MFIATVSMSLCIGIIGIGSIIFLGFSIVKINDIFRSTFDKNKPRHKKEVVNKNKVDEVSLQIDSLNNLYKNKVITLDEFVKGVDEIGRKNKQNEINN